MLYYLLVLAFVSALPVFELRASIPLGLLKPAYAAALPAWTVITVCILANTAIAAPVYLLTGLAVKGLRRLAWFDRFYARYQERVIARIRPGVEKYGWLGLALFIGVPLPGSGVYSGAIGAIGLGMSFRKYMAAAVIGVIIAGTVVALLILSGAEGVKWLTNKELLSVLAPLTPKAG